MKRTAWEYAGSVKVKVSGRRNVDDYVEFFAWKCAKCGQVVKVTDNWKPQFWCANCKKKGSGEKERG